MPTNISIIVSVFNEEKYLEKCLKSLINQKYSKNDYEIIFVDDGSTDKSVEIIKRFLTVKRPKIRLIKSEHVGMASARNLGIGVARSKFVCIVDADMILDDNYLKQIERDIKNFDMVDHTEKSIITNSISEYISLVRKHQKKPVHARAFKKKIMEKYESKYGYYCDAELTNRLVNGGYNLGMSKALVYHHESDNFIVFFNMGKSMRYYSNLKSIFYTLSSLTPFFIIPSFLRAIKYKNPKVFFLEWLAKILMSIGFLCSFMKRKSF